MGNSKGQSTRPPEIQKRIKELVFKNDGTIYGYFGGDYYINMTTGKHGDIPQQIAEKSFKKSEILDFFFNNCSTFEELITRLNLKIDKNI